MPTVQFKNTHIHFDLFDANQAHGFDLQEGQLQKGQLKDPRKSLVLLHGFLEDSSMWAELEESLSKDFNIVCIDLLGHGQSGSLAEVYTMELQAEACFQVLDGLKIDRFSVIGHSMGGYIALCMTEMRPKAIEALLLMNSSSFPDSAEKKENRDRASLVVEQDHKSFVKLSMPNLFAPQNRPHLKKEIKALIKQAQNMRAEDIIASLQGMKVRKDRSPLFREVKIKKGMIIGNQDQALPIDALHEQARYAQVVSIVLDGGHMSHLEATEDWLAFIENFL